MKKFIISCGVFCAMLILIVIHSFSMRKMGEEIKNLSKATEECAIREEWDKTEENMKKIRKEWEKREIWTALTIKTNEIEQIEISLCQSEKYAKLKDKNKFVGEFTMFSKLVEHIPHQEGFRMEEIL